jgi:hypothetical protein
MDRELDARQQCRRFSYSQSAWRTFLLVWGPSPPSRNALMHDERDFLKEINNQKKEIEALMPTWIAT